MASNFKIESIGLFLLNNDANITKKIHSSGLVFQAAIWASNSAIYMPSAPQKLMPLNGHANEFLGEMPSRRFHFCGFGVIFTLSVKSKKRNAFNAFRRYVEKFFMNIERLDARFHFGFIRAWFIHHVSIYVV